MEYKILYAITFDEMQKEINNYIKKGWTPQGGLCNTKYNLAQGMIKTSKETEQDTISSLIEVLIPEVGWVKLRDTNIKIN